MLIALISVKCSHCDLYSSPRRWPGWAWVNFSPTLETTWHFPCADDSSGPGPTTFRGSEHCSLYSYSDNAIRPRRTLGDLPTYGTWIPSSDPGVQSAVLKSRSKCHQGPKTIELGYSEVPGLQGSWFKLMRRHESRDSGNRRHSSRDRTVGQTSIGRRGAVEVPLLAPFPSDPESKDICPGGQSLPEGGEGLK